MSAVITINFAGGTATFTQVDIALTDCTIAPGLNNGVVVAMASALTNITAVAGQIILASSTGAPFNGSIALAIDWSSNEPSVTLNNLSNNPPTMVTWPTTGSPSSAVLTPGNPVTLSGIVNAPA